MYCVKASLVPCLLALMVLEILHQLTGATWAAQAAYIAMALAIAMAVRTFGAREFYLLTLSAVMFGLIFTLHPDPLTATIAALDQAVFLMAFLLCISLIQEAAQTSRSVGELGHYLAWQPGGRRYTGLYTGTMTMAVVFNIGTLSLLAPLITRGAAKATDDPLGPIRERRQLNAVVRGFAWSVVWSPTAISPIALYVLLPEADRAVWIGLGLLLAFVMLGVGWLEDRIAWRNHTAEAYGLPPIPIPPLPVRALRRFLGVCAGLAIVTGVFMALFGLGVPGALMGASPIVMVLWLWGQETKMLPRVTEIFRDGLPATTPAALTLGCAGFVGISGAALLPAQEIADWINLDAVPAWVFLIGTVVAVVILSQFGLSPIMMAVFFGAVLAGLDSLPASQTMTALAVSTGLAVSTTFSPFAAGVVFLSRVTSHPGTRLTYRWNGLFTALSLAVLTIAYWVMTGGT